MSDARELSDRLQRRLDRERKARAEAESIAEGTTAELYSSLRKVERSNAELEAANRAIREFVSIASHDLRGPITTILGFSTIVKDAWKSLSDEQRNEYLDIIHKQGEKLDRLVTDLLTISKIEAGSIEARLQEIRVDRVLEEIIREMGETSERIELFVPSSAVQALADPDHLDRMVRNYLTNALKYGRPPIEARVIMSDGWAEIRIVDHGDGVPAELEPRLFERFARGDDAATRSQEGTGLGLSIVKGLAQANGGDAWYEPAEPTGACFAVRLRAAG